MTLQNSLLSERLVGIYRFRGFIAGSVKREFASRYRNSALGAAWLILQPLSQILVYTLVFSHVMRAHLASGAGPFSYSIFLCAGSLTWGLFTEIVGRGQNVFLDNATLLKKLSFPRLCLPIIVVLNAVVNFAIIFGLFTAFLLFSHTFPGWAYFALFPVLAVQALFAIGLGMVLGVLNVFFRDVGQFFGIVLQFWFWLTPIVYPLASLPAHIQGWVRLNPMTQMAVAYQDILLHGTLPDWMSMLPVAIAGVVLCALGLLLFKRCAGELVDEL
ncbi:MAG TPA: ABC transporter permease [Oscillatoriaceae cyanobacterium]